jgi:TrmH family RNA methyltransferase
MALQSTNAETATDFFVILVEPKYDGNIGAIARSMKNFGIQNLILVRPCELTDNAYKMAMHSKDILHNAAVCESLDEALASMHYVIGTSGTVSSNERHYLRNPLTPQECLEKLRDVQGNVGVLFGREDFGLYTEELERCDLVVRIPTAEKTPIMNIASAATVMLYEISRLRAAQEDDAVYQNKKSAAASVAEKEKLYEHFSLLLDEVLYPPYKKEKTMTMVRRILGRAVLTEPEFYTVMGIINDAIKMIRDAEGSKKLTRVKEKQKKKK